MKKTISKLVILFIAFGIYHQANAQVTTTGTATICESVSTTITAVPDAALLGVTTYNWLPGSLVGAAQSVSPIVTTTYTVTATNDGTDFVSTVKITVNPKPILTISSPSPICNDVLNPITIVSSTPGANTLSWTSSGTSGLQAASANSPLNSLVPSMTVNQQFSGITTATSNRVYIFTNKSAAGCDSDPTNYTQSIHQKPLLTVGSNAFTCSDAASGFNISSNIPGANTLSWTSVGTSALNAVSANSPFVSPSNSFSINQQFTGLTTAQSNRTFTFKIQSNSGCFSSNVVVTQNVFQKPTITASSASPICNDVANTINVISNIAGANTLSWISAGTSVLNATSDASPFVSATNIMNISQSFSGITSGTSNRVYTFTTKSSDGCDSDPINYTQNVFQKPALSISSTSPVCNDAANNINIVSTTPGNNTLSWTSFGTSALNAASTNSPLNSVTPNMNINQQFNGITTGTSNRVYSFTNISSDGCNSGPIAYTQNIFQKPALTISSINPTCNDLATNINIVSTTAGANTLSWTSVGTSGLGAASAVPPLSAATSTMNISQQFNGLTTSATNRVYTFTNLSANGCPSSPFNYTQNIFEKPTILTASPITICSGDRPTFDVSTDNLELLNWSIFSSSALLSGITPNNSPSPAIVFNNNINNSSPANAVINSVTYNLIPTSDKGCIGVPKNITVDVKPGSNPTPISNQTLCNGTSTNLITFTSNVPGAIFSWVNDNTSIGLAAAGGGATIPSFTATNTTTLPVVATIQVSYSTPGCGAGTSTTTFSITVNPTPIINAVASQIVCNASNSNSISFSSSVLSLYAWTNDNSTIGLPLSGNNNISSFVAANASNTLTNEGNFTVTPTSVVGTCPGLPTTFTITVNPTPLIGAVLNQTLCNNASTNIIAFSSSVPSTFNWVNNRPSIGVTAGVSNTIASFTGINTSPFVSEIGTFTVTPASTNGCIGTATNFNIEVYPTPVLSNITDQTLCNTFTTNKTNLSSSNNSNFIWSTSLDIGSGLTGNATVAVPSIATFTAVNASTIASIVSIFTVTPTSTNSCTGAPKTFSITVNPTPLIDAITDETICNGANTPIKNFTTGTLTSTFTWINSNTSIGAFNNGTGNLNSFVAIDTSNSIATTSTFSVTPTSLIGNCLGAATTFNITVNPSPQITPTSDEALCNGSSTSPILFTSSVAGTTFNWTNDNTNTNLANAGSGNISSFIATNSGNVDPDTSNIFVTTTSAGLCTGSKDTFRIVVHPTPTVAVTSPEICSKLFTQINVTPSTIGNNTYTKILAISNPNIFTPTNQTVFASNITQDSLVNSNTSIAENISYFITIKSAFGCTDPIISRTPTIQTINPTPELKKLTDTICSRGNLAFTPEATTTLPSTFTWSLLNNNPNDFTKINSSLLDINSTGTNGEIISTYMTDKNIDVKTKLDSLTYLFTITSNKGCVNTQTDAVHKDSFVLWIKPTPNPFVSISQVDSGSYCKKTRHQLYKIGRASKATENINWRFANTINTNIYQSADSTNTFALLRSDSTNTIIITSSFDNFASCTISETTPFVLDVSTNTSDPILLIKKYANGDSVLECLANNIQGDYKWGRVNKNTLIETTYITEKGQEYLMKSSNNDDTVANFYWVEVKLNNDNCIRRVYLKDTKLGNKISNPNSHANEIFAMNVYPNPTSNIINVSIEGIRNVTDCSIIIYDMVGNKILERDLQSDKFSTSIEQLESGCYFIACKQNGKTIATQKIIKK
jgi:Secretion system C-terminal sorting domain/PKD-like domain